MDPRQLPVGPEGGVIVHLDHSGPVQLDHSDLALGTAIPGFRIVPVHRLELPDRILDRAEVFGRHGLVEDHVAVVFPEIEFGLGEDVHGVAWGREGAGANGGELLKYPRTQGNDGNSKHGRLPKRNWEGDAGMNSVEFVPGNNGSRMWRRVSHRHLDRWPCNLAHRRESRGRRVARLIRPRRRV